MAMEGGVDRQPDFVQTTPNLNFTRDPKIKQLHVFDSFQQGSGQYSATSAALR